MATIVAVHGAWSAGWAWRKMRPLLAAAGHDLVTPTLTGIGERSHLATPAVDLETHIRDVLAVLQYEDLTDIVLVGHSYGGMVVTGVQNRAPERIRELVYLDAFVPKNGESVFSHLPPAMQADMLSRTLAEGEGWRLPANPVPPDTLAEDRAWIAPRRGFQPLLTQTQAISLDPGVPLPPRHYIFCTRTGPGDVFRPFAERAASEPGWTRYDIDASHSPHVTAPEALAALLVGIAGKGAA